MLKIYQKKFSEDNPNYFYIKVTLNTKPLAPILIIDPKTKNGHSPIKKCPFYLVVR